MILLDYIVVGLIIALAALYLFRTFFPKSKRGGCACGSVDCKVPKPKLDRLPN
ncbi:MAG: FeoB-associated Cys-rich membrane protein [Opitutales bacterium]